MGLPIQRVAHDVGPTDHDARALPRPWASTLCGAAAIALIGFVVGFRPIFDMDFHWHLAAGRVDLAGKLAEDHDPFTHLPIVRSVDLGCRAGDLLFALVDRAAGLRGVRILCALGLAALYLQAFRLGVARTGTLAAGAVAAALVAALSFERVQHRPDLFVPLFVFLLVHWLWQGPGWNSAAKIFALSALWANFHGSSPLAPALALLAAVSAGPAGWRHLGSVLAASAGICMRPHGPLFTFHLVRETAAIAYLSPEWHALWNLGVDDFPSAVHFAGVWVRFGIVLGIVLWGAMATTPEGGPQRADAANERRSDAGRKNTAKSLLSGLMAVVPIGMASTSFRLFYLMGLSVFWSLERRAKDLRASPRLRAGMIVMASLLFILFPLRDRWRAAARARAAGLSVWGDLDTPSFPVAAAAYLEAHDLRGNLFSPPEWGGYLACELTPRYRIAFDGRVQLYGRELAAELLEFVDARRRPDLVERFALEILVLPAGTLANEIGSGFPLADLDTQQRWLRVQENGTSEVFVDRRGPNWEHNRLVLRNEQ